MSYQPTPSEWSTIAACLGYRAQDLEMFSCGRRDKEESKAMIGNATALRELAERIKQNF